MARGKSKPNTERGKGAPTGGQGPSHAPSAWRCPSHTRAAQHTGARRSCRGHRSRWRRMPPDDGDEIRELEALRPSTRHGPLSQPDPARGLRHASRAAGPPTRSGRVTARARKPVDRAVLFSVPRLLTHRMTLPVTSNEYYGKWPLVLRST